MLGTPGHSREKKGNRPWPWPQRAGDLVEWRNMYSVVGYQGVCARFWKRQWLVLIRGIKKGFREEASLEVGSSRMRMLGEGYRNDIWGRWKNIAQTQRLWTTSAWQVWEKEMPCCLEYRGRMGGGMLGEVPSSRNHSQGTPASALLLSPMPGERKCPLSCSLSWMSASSETLSDNKDHCHLWSLLCTRMKKQRLKELCQS